MKYTVYLELSFENKEDAAAILNDVEKIKAKAYKQTPGYGLIELQTKTELWETHHDENPPKQCKKLDTVDFGKATEAIHA